MKQPALTTLKSRLVTLAIFCLIMAVWNMALSTRRKYFSGEMLKVEQKPVVLKVDCLGKIEPKVQELVRAQLDGKREEVYVKEGDSVQKGQLLMKISDEKIRIEMNQKRANFRNASADYAKAKKDYQLERSLFRQGAVPERDVENAKQTLERAGQSLVAAREELAITEKKAKGVRVVAPISGVVITLLGENEEWVSMEKELVQIAKLDEFIVRGQVDELEIAQLQVGQEAVVTCDAFPGKELAGRVSWISAQAKTGAFAELEIKIDILDTQGLNLKPNLTCEAMIVTGQIPLAVALPAHGIRQGEKGPFVLKSRWGGWLQVQPVEVGRVSAGTAIITKGLEPGDSVLVPKGE